MVQAIKGGHAQSYKWLGFWYKYKCGFMYSRVPEAISLVLIIGDACVSVKLTYNEL